MSVRTLLDEATGALAAAGVASPRNDAELLLAHVTGMPRSMLFVARPDEAQRQVFTQMIASRARRVPLQHLTGTAAFRHVEVEVGPGVFVPRPETELLAGWAIDTAARVDDPVVVELCAGSGAVSLSIVNELARATVHAVELDERAFGWAQLNLAGTGVDLRLGDMTNAFSDLDGRVDVVVANPPYIPLDAWESVAPEVRDHDPALALWSGRDGLDALRIVESTAWRLLRPGGFVGTEHADVQRDSVVQIFTSRWTDVRDHDDLAGKPRYVVARKPETTTGTA